MYFRRIILNTKSSNMLQDLIKEHAGDITNLLGSKFGLNSQEASGTANILTDAIGGFLTNQLSSGKLDLNQIVDLFNTSTPNKSNSLFSSLSSLVTNALTSKSGLGGDVISNIATNGLDEILGMLGKGKLGNIDLGTVTQIAGALSGGKGGGIGDLLGGLSGLLGKK